MGKKVAAKQIIKKTAKKKQVQPKRKVGRPPKSNKKAIQNAVCYLISTTSLSLRKILEELKKKINDVPDYKTIKDWLVKDEEFRTQYTQAKEMQIELYADELLEIADDSSLDMAFTEEGKPFVDHEHVNRSRLRVDTRKWLLSKLMPKKYGDKMELSGNKDQPLTVEVIRFGDK
jgi:hypothetical protein